MSLFEDIVEFLEEKGYELNSKTELAIEELVTILEDENDELDDDDDDDDD
jgi:hypothetical protein